VALEKYLATLDTLRIINRPHWHYRPNLSDLFGLIATSSIKNMWLELPYSSSSLSNTLVLPKSVQRITVCCYSGGKDKPSVLSFLARHSNEELRFWLSLPRVRVIRWNQKMEVKELAELKKLVGLV